MRKDVLQSVGQLKRVHVAQAVLHHTIDHQFRESQNLARQVERLRGANGLKITKETTQRLL